MYLGKFDRGFAQFSRRQMRDNRYQVRSRQRTADFLSQPIAERRMFGFAVNQPKRKDGQRGPHGRRWHLRYRAVERKYLFRIKPHRLKPAIESIFTQIYAFEEFTSTGASDKRHLGQIEGDVRVCRCKDICKTAIHDQLDVGQRPSQTLPTTVVASSTPKRILQKCACPPTERSGRQKGEKSLVLGAGNLELAGRCGTDSACAKQAYFDYLGSHAYVSRKRSVVCSK